MCAVMSRLNAGARLLTAHEHIVAAKAVAFGEALQPEGLDQGIDLAGKTIEECAPGDPICTGGPAQWTSHLQPSYIDSGLVDQAANFVAGKL